MRCHLSLCKNLEVWSNDPALPNHNVTCRCQLLLRENRINFSEELGEGFAEQVSPKSSPGYK